MRTSASSSSPARILARRTAIRKPPSSSTSPRSWASAPVQTRPRATRSTASVVRLRPSATRDTKSVYTRSASASRWARCSGVNGASIDHASALALVRTVSDPTPSRPSRSRITSLPVMTPIEPVIVAGLATIASAATDT